MPRKSSSKKSSTNSAANWYHCEKCNVHITSKDRETHYKHCPITPETGEPLEYIYNNYLCTIGVQRRTFIIDELRDVTTKYRNNLIFLSEGAMRLTSLYIGQRVLIQSKEVPGASGLVRIVWPIPDRFLTTAYVGEEDYKLYWTAFANETLQICALPLGCTKVAKTVQLRLTAVDGESIELDDIQFRNVERLLKFELKKLIFTKHSDVFMDFFNKDLTMQVISWTSFEDMTKDEQGVELLEAKLDNLKLENTKTKTFFEVTGATRLEIVRPEKQCEEEELSANINNVVTKLDIGGLENQIEVIQEAMEMALGLKFVPEGVKVARCFLLHGPTGCGKSLICEAMCSAVQEIANSTIAKLTKADIIRINASEIFSKFLGETEKNLLSYFEKVYTNYPRSTLVIIEDVHNICAKHELNEMTQRVGAAFLGILDTLNGRKREAQRIFLLATTSQIDALNPNARRCGRLDSEIEVGAPTPEQRTAILHCLLRNIDHTLTHEQIVDIAQVLHGYVGADLANLVNAAALRALKDETAQRSVNIQDLQTTLTHIKPSAMREVLIENPNIHWSDIGGQADLKLKLKQAIEWPLLYPDKFVRLGLKPPRGILMYGPPGCSKTMIAKALATESQLNFLSIKGPELFSMWVGESERAVREVFRKARQVAPAIVFFDEIDAIGGKRADTGGSGTSVKERVLTQLLTEMDGVETLENVTIVGATNRPDMIDKALLRPGRFDRIVYVGLPDAAARRDIFRIKLQAMPVADELDVEMLVQRSEGYSGAEIQAACQEAALKCLEESFEAVHIKWAHFEYALQAIQPRTSPELLKLYDDYRKQR
ncbi:ATPase family gene 2 protein homolog A [Eurosta solidaginis]|uniref:ATPase family gene 2 protein homolog A n=1 Tax=Eurosta solidaginis TaxID=178769 RepID=UPI0035313E3F